MFSNTWGNFELVHFLCRNLFGMRAHHEINLVGGAIDLLKQPLQINGSAGASRCNYKLHRQRITSDQAADKERRLPSHRERFGKYTAVAAVHRTGSCLARALSWFASPFLKGRGFNLRDYFFACSPIEQQSAHAVRLLTLPSPRARRRGKPARLTAMAIEINRRYLI